jgi:hypothetical protein
VSADKKSIDAAQNAYQHRKIAKWNGLMIFR